MRRAIRKIAIPAGYRCYHTKSSRFSDKGWPDEALCNREDPTLILWELKREKGTLTPHQELWGDLLRGRPGIDYRVIRPRDFQYVIARLTARRPIEWPQAERRDA